MRLCILLLLMWLAHSSWGHPGAVDKDGGHVDTATRIWHGHKGDRIVAIRDPKGTFQLRLPPLWSVAATADPHADVRLYRPEVAGRFRANLAVQVRDEVIPLDYAARKKLRAEIEKALPGMQIVREFRLRLNGLPSWRLEYRLPGENKMRLSGFTQVLVGKTRSWVVTCLSDTSEWPAVSKDADRLLQTFETR